MKVVLGTIYPYDESRPRGGVEAVALYLTQALGKRDDIELHVVSCNSLISRSCTERRGSVTFHWLKTGHRLYSLRAATVDAWRVKKVYREIQPDIIHTQGFTEYALAVSPDHRHLLAIHGVESLVPWMRRATHFRGVAGIYRRWIGPRIARQSIQKAQGIVSNAGDYIPTLLALWLEGKSIYPIFNPIADEFFRIEGTNEVENPTVLWVGTISERKNVLGLIEVFGMVSEHIPKAHLRLIGGVTDPRYFERVKDEITARNLWDSIIISDRVEQTSLLDAYSIASMVVMASIEETAPMAIAQAMAAGKPVVATRVGGIPWMIEDGVTGYLLDVGDTKGVADRMIELLRDESKQGRMGQAGREIARQRFAADKVAEQTVQAYRDLLEKKEM
ncbi:MAG: glycosyltransferase family 4 protein [Candidatus Aminicenantales bacterium]